MSYIFRYTVTYYNEIDCVDKNESGFVVANSTLEATEKIVNEYGDDQIFVLTLCFFSEGELVSDDIKGIDFNLLRGHVNQLVAIEEKYTCHFDAQHD